MRLFYGWVIVGVALISMAFWFGIRRSRGEAAGVQSMAMVVYSCLAPMAGGLIDRFGPEWVDSDDPVAGILLEPEEPCYGKRERWEAPSQRR